MKKVITRFAPSPTGYLHIGGLRTALYSYLWAKKHRGLFKLRIEDTDQKREVPGAKEHLIATLDTFGLHPDGEIVIQSDNHQKGIYREHAERLIAEKKAYYCFCTTEELEAVRHQQEKNKQQPKYPGTCKKLTQDVVEKKLADNEPHVIRLCLPDKKTITVEDGIHGTINFDVASLNEAVLIKSDGFPTYHLANIVDDHTMGITHVIRGDEWIPSLPLHSILYEYFGFSTPSFNHLPLILNPNKSKLSKRQGDVSVESYLEKGYLKEALINFISMLGWNPGDDRELFSLDDLIELFDISHVHKAGAVFSIDKLNWYNNWCIKNILAVKPKKEISKIIAPFTTEIPEDKRLITFTLFFERIEKLSDLTAISAFLRELPSYESDLLIFKKSTKEKSLNGLRSVREMLTTFDRPWTTINLDLALKETMTMRSLSFGDLYWPVRVAVSGLTASPSPAEIIMYLGKDESIARIDMAIRKLS